MADSVLQVIEGLGASPAVLAIEGNEDEGYRVVLVLTEAYLHRSSAERMMANIEGLLNGTGLETTPF